MVLFLSKFKASTTVSKNATRAAVDEQESVQVPEGMNMRIPMHSQNRSSQFLALMDESQPHPKK